jgi:hypothetical protein
MSRDRLGKRVEALEAEVLPHVKEDPPESIMGDVITAEWVKAWEGTGPECIEAAIDDWIARLEACPVTARLGSQIATYREVLIEHLRDEVKRWPSTPQGGDAEYKEA